MKRRRLRTTTQRKRERETSPELVEKHRVLISALKQKLVNINTYYCARNERTYSFLLFFFLVCVCSYRAAR